MTEMNPYATPASPVGGADAQEVGEVRILSARGRLGRIRYIGYSLGVSLLVGLLAALSGAVAAALPESVGGMSILIGAGIPAAVAVVLGILLTIQRLHDLDWTGWWVLLLLIPYLGGLFSLLLWLLPGTRGTNRYGPVPPPNGKGVTVLAMLLPAVALIGVLAAIAIPAYQDYVQRSQAADAR